MNDRIDAIPLASNSRYALQASRWQKYPMLLNEEEMRSLFACLGECWIIQTGGLLTREEGCLSLASFLSAYDTYLACVKEGGDPYSLAERTYFSSVLTCSLEAVYFLPIKENKGLIKIRRPVIQLQLHRFDYFPADETFRSMVFGPEAIHWGIQFSYPYLYQDEELQVVAVGDTPDWPNTTLFKRLQQWNRHHTLPTPLLVQGKRTNVPIRLGKGCFSWINAHPQLKRKGLQVVV